MSYFPLTATHQMVTPYNWAFSTEICHSDCVSLMLKPYSGGKEVVINKQAGATYSAHSSQVEALTEVVSHLNTPRTEPRWDPTAVKVFRLGLPLTCWDLFSKAAQRHYSPHFLGKKSRKSHQEVALCSSLTGLHQEHMTVGFGLSWCFCFIFLAMSYLPSACYFFPMKNLTFTNHQVNDSSLLHLWIRL